MNYAVQHTNSPMILSNDIRIEFEMVIYCFKDSKGL